MSDLDELFAAALAVRGRAYAPYSRYPVGAAVRDEAGRIHTGCNVENAAYPAGTCAEAGAIAALIAAGGRRITAVCVVGESAAGAPCTPCGACRQRIREFAAPDAAIHCADPGGVRLTLPLSALLPHGFGPDHLPVTP